MAQSRTIELVTPLGTGVLLLQKFSGTETLGRSFEYEIFALSERNDLNFDDLLGHHITINLESPGDKPRHIDARVAQFGLVGMQGRYWRYRIVARPWLWVLTRTADCKIFQEKSVPEIIEEVFSDHGDVDFELRLSGSYARREYCVQYRETDFAFVSRLMEEEGIYYFFEHRQGKHILILCDGASAHPSIGPLPFFPQSRPVREGEECIREWSVSRQILPGAAALRDYDFEKPSVDLLVQRAHDRPTADPAHEIFDYPGEYIEPVEGEHLVRTRLEEIQAAHEEIEGLGNTRALACGGRFSLTGFPRADQNGEYLVVSNRIEAANNSYESGQAQDIDYRCTFRLIPVREPYRSPRTTPRPVVRGPQTAVVVGKPPQEIDVDKYGRVKVQFHWDRLGKYDDKSSCWIRVSQAWAGKNFGWMSIPRIGQEVIVSFLEGNPDNPIITGRVYNAEQMPPYELPGNATQSGITSRSSPGGGPGNANEIRFEDRKGSEQLYIHAEKDKSSHVENDDSTFVGNDQGLTVKRDQTTTVTRDQKLTVERDRSVHVVANETHDVDLMQTLTVGTDQIIHVVGNQHTQVDQEQTLNVTGNITTNTLKNRTDVTTGDEVRVVTGNQNVAVTGNLDYKATRMLFEADHIEYKITGANSAVHEAKNGPYSIMANKINLMSNTDISLYAAGTIHQNCLKSVVTKMGPDDSSCFSMSSSMKLAMTSDVFIGLKSAMNIAADFTTTLGLQSGFTLAAKLDTSIGPSMTFSTMKAYVPPGAAPPGAAIGSKLATGETVASANKALAALFTNFTGIGLSAALVSPLASSDEKDKAAARAKAKKETLLAAKAALQAGHPGLAKRLMLLALGDAKELGSWTPGSTNDIATILTSPLTEMSIDSQLAQLDKKPPA